MSLRPLAAATASCPPQPLPQMPPQPSQLCSGCAYHTMAGAGFAADIPCRGGVSARRTHPVCELVHTSLGAPLHMLLPQSPSFTQQMSGTLQVWILVTRQGAWSWSEGQEALRPSKEGQGQPQAHPPGCLLCSHAREGAPGWRHGLQCQEAPGSHPPTNSAALLTPVPFSTLRGVLSPTGWQATWRGAGAKPKPQTLANGGSQETHELAEAWESMFTVFAASKADTPLGLLTLAWNPMVTQHNSPP